MKKLQRIAKELENKRKLLRCAKEFNVIGDFTRIKICYLLCHYQELSVGEIAEAVGVSTSAASHALQKLKAINLVKSRRDFRYVYYQLKEKPQLAKMLKKRLAGI